MNQDVYNAVSDELSKLDNFTELSSRQFQDISREIITQMRKLDIPGIGDYLLKWKNEFDYGTQNYNRVADPFLDVNGILDYIRENS